MNYPLWDVPLIGGGLVIALIAIPHIFVSHFAIGGGIFLAFTERKANRENNTYLKDFVRKNTLFFVLLTLVFGAVTGVGIWYSIQLVHPPATSLLIHNFVFGWAIEWVFFLVEISAALIYYYSWDRVSPKVHNTIGWIYAIAAFMSLVIINGILTFMLTPGSWLTEGGFWTGFFNPTYFPSLVIRACVCLALAWLYMLYRASLEEPGKDRDGLVTYISKWLIPALVGLPVFGAWFILEMPQLAREMTQGAAAAVTLFTAVAVMLSVVIFLFAYFAGYRNPGSVTPQWALLLMLLGFGATGATEWVREAVRKPYIIYNHMYSNAIRVSDVDEISRRGVLESAMWVTTKDVSNTMEAGENIFRLECAACHTMEGYNGISLLIRNWDQAYLATQLLHLDKLKGFMPPFVGTDAEREALATWLASRTQEGGAE